MQATSTIARPGALGESGALALVMPSGAWLLTPKDGTEEAAGADLDSSMVALVIAELPDHTLEFFILGGLMRSVRSPLTRPRRSSSCARSPSIRSPSGPTWEGGCHRGAPTSTPNRARTVFGCWWTETALDGTVDGGRGEAADHWAVSWPKVPGSPGSAGTLGRRSTRWGKTIPDEGGMWSPGD